MNQKNVLVVDDDQDIRTQLATLVGHHGYGVYLAANVDQAMGILHTEAISLVLLDVMMDRDSDGFNLAQSLKSDSRWRDVPIVMITSVNQRSGFTFDPKVDGDFLPVESFLEKPIDPEQVMIQVKRYLG